MNKAHVVAAYPSKVHPGCTHIDLNARAGNGGARSVVTMLGLETVLSICGPFVSVELKRIDDGTPVDYHVRQDAIVAVRHLPAGGGRVWLVNGEDLYVTDEAIKTLAALVVTM